MWESGRSHLTLLSREDCPLAGDSGRVGLGGAPTGGTPGCLRPGALPDDSGHHAATDCYSVGSGSIIRLMKMLQTRIGARSDSCHYRMLAAQLAAQLVACELSSGGPVDGWERDGWSV